MQARAQQGMPVAALSTCRAMPCLHSPGGDVGGEVGALIGIYKLGCSRDIFPLGLVSSSCNSSRSGAGHILEA